MILLRRVRGDALPENLDYLDRGCDIWRRCLTCPLPRCRYDEPGGARRILNEARDRRIVDLKEEKALPVGELARRYGLSRRTVFRILSKATESATSGVNARAQKHIA
jgi:AraC-like DNA-binding protein